MKFQLSTLMLVIAIICIAVGWFIDRRIQEHHTKTLVRGAITYTLSDSLGHRMRDDTSADKFDFEGVASVLSLYESSAALGDFAVYAESELGQLGVEPSALRMTRDLLDALDCETADAFFDKLESHDSLLDFLSKAGGWYVGGESVGSRYQEYKNPNSPEHTALRSFIEDALNSAPNYLRD